MFYSMLGVPCSPPLLSLKCSTLPAFLLCLWAHIPPISRSHTDPSFSPQGAFPHSDLLVEHRAWQIFYLIIASSSWINGMLAGSGDGSAVKRAHRSPLFQRTRVWVPGPTPSGSRPPVTPVLGAGKLSSGFHGRLCIYTVLTHIYVHICIIKKEIHLFKEISVCSFVCLFVWVPCGPGF